MSEAMKSSKSRSQRSTVIEWHSGWKKKILEMEEKLHVMWETSEAVSHVSYHFWVFNRFRTTSPRWHKQNRKGDENPVLKRVQRADFKDRFSGWSRRACSLTQPQRWPTCLIPSDRQEQWSMTCHVNWFQDKLLSTPTHQTALRKRPFRNISCTLLEWGCRVDQESANISKKKMRWDTASSRCRVQIFTAKKTSLKK